MQLKCGRIANQVCIAVEKKAEVKKILPCYWCYPFLTSFFILVIQIYILQDNLIARQLLLSYPSCAVHNYCGFLGKKKGLFFFLNIIFMYFEEILYSGNFLHFFCLYLTGFNFIKKRPNLHIYEKNNYVVSGFTRQNTRQAF